MNRIVRNWTSDADGFPPLWSSFRDFSFWSWHELCKRNRWAGQVSTEQGGSSYILPTKGDWWGLSRYKFAWSFFACWCTENLFNSSGFFRIIWKCYYFAFHFHISHWAKREELTIRVFPNHLKVLLFCIPFSHVTLGETWGANHPGFSESFESAIILHSIFTCHIGRNVRS
jgi:hypothetical protein